MRRNERGWEIIAEKEERRGQQGAGPRVAEDHASSLGRNAPDHDEALLDDQERRAGHGVGSSGMTRPHSASFRVGEEAKRVGIDLGRLLKQGAHARSFSFAGLVFM